MTAGDFLHADVDTDHGDLWTDEGPRVLLVVPALTATATASTGAPSWPNDGWRPTLRLAGGRGSTRSSTSGSHGRRRSRRGAARWSDSATPPHPCSANGPTARTCVEGAA